MNSRALDFLLLQFPKPTAAFIVDLTPELIMERLQKAQRRHYALEFYEFLAERYREFALRKAIPLINNVDLQGSFSIVRRTLTTILTQNGDTQQSFLGKNRS